MTQDEEIPGLMPEKADARQSFFEPDTALLILCLSLCAFAASHDLTAAPHHNRWSLNPCQELKLLPYACDQGPLLQKGRTNIMLQITA
jgi:hypothetical protein